MLIPKSPLLVLTVCLASFGAQAQVQSGKPPLPAWDKLDNRQREALVAPVRARWDADPEARERMLAHAERWQSMSPTERDRARRGMRRWDGMSPEARQQMRALHARLRSLPEDERGALRARWKAMTPDERAAWARAHPAPGHAAGARGGARP